MANLTTCLQKVGAKLDPADKAAVMARSRELRTLAKERGEPMSATDAAIQAAKDVISEIRAELKAAEPAQPAQRKSAHPKTVMGSELLAIVSARLGGLDPSLISEFSVNVPTGKFYKNGVERTEWRNPMIPGVGKLFRRGGRQDRQEIAQVLEDADYLEPGAVANDYKEAGERAKELIKAALDRNIPKTLSEQQAEMEASQEAERKAYYDALDEESAAEADAERAAIMAEAGMGRVEMDAVDDADLFNMAGGTTDTATQMRAMGFTEQEIADELAREAQVAAAAAQASPGQDAQAGPEAAPEAGPAGTAAAQRGAEPAEGLVRNAPNRSSAGPLGDVNAKANKRVPDVGEVGPNSLADLLESQAFLTQGLGALQIPAQRAVLSQVVGLLHDPEIRKSVVQLVPVNVVDFLAGKQGASKRLLNDPSVLQNMLALDGNLSVPEFVDGASRVALIAALHAAKRAPVSSEFRRLAEKFGPAIRARNKDASPARSAPTSAAAVEQPAIGVGELPVGPVEAGGTVSATDVRHGGGTNGSGVSINDRPADAPSPFADNKVFTQSDVDAARALLKKKLGQLNSGIDPELMQAGITIAGAYIESGVRKFADFARVMVDDLGDRVKPYLHSWYMALRADPRSAAFRDEMDRASAVEDLDVDAVLAAPKAEPAKQAATGKIDDFFKTVEQKADDAGNVALLSQRPGSAYDQAFQRAVLGEATADDRRTIQSRPGYGNRAETALAGNVDAARALRGELEAAFGTNGGPFLDSRRGAIAVQSVWLRSASDADLARLTEAADRFNAPIIARGLESQDSPAFVKRMRAAGFETYTGMLEAGDRNVRDVAIAMVRPGGGITATTPLFSRGLGRGTPLSTLKPHIDAITAKMPGLRNAVTVVGTVTDLPQGIVDSLRSMNALGTVRGLRMPDGRVFLVADKLDSQLEAEFVLFHEVFGHEGLRAILNAEEYARAMTLVRLSNKAVAAEADRWMNSYGADQIEARIQNGMTPEAARREVRLLAVEEALADRAGKNDAPSVWKNVMAIVQKALRRMGMNDLANWLENRTEAETYALLMQARKAITNPKKVHAFTPATSPLFQRAYHGTPARNIERFSTDFIGTGEGNQAYGYGLYFASRRDVAEYYRRALSGESDRVFTKDGKTLEGDADLAEAYYKPGRIVRGYSGADKVLQFKRNDNGGWGVQVVGVKANGEAMQFERPRWHSTLPDGSTLRSVLEEDGWNPSHAGQIYEVEIPGDDELLLWDKPMSEQPAKVRDALAPFIERYTDNQRKIMSAFSPAEIEREIKAGLKTISGQGIYEQAGYMEGGGDRSASEYLSSLGVKGIKYLDGVSRNKPLRDVKREFLAELPEDAGFDEVMDLIGSGTFSQKNEAVLRALADNDWLGFDYPAQAISTALSSQLSNFDPSPELVQAVAATQDDSTYNYVIFSGDDVAIQQALLSRRPPPLAPAVTVQPDANGNPEFAGDGVVLAYPQPAERFEFIPGPGQRLLNYAIMPATGFDSMGFVELVVENGRVTSLMDIEVNGAGRRAGVGRKVIETILAANPDADVNISNIVHQARGFWAKMGVPEQNLEDGAAYDGTLNWQAYAQAANDGRAAQVGQGMRGQAGADDRGRQGAGRGAEGGAQAPVLSQKPSTQGPIATAAQQSLPAQRQPLPASWRDPTNRLQFAPGEWLYNALGRLAAPLLIKLQVKAATPEMRRQLRQMKLDVQKAQDVAVAVANDTAKLSDVERQMVSDIIEREVAAGTVPPAHAVRLAAMMNQAMGEQSKELVRLGMLTQEAADRWDGAYLPRFYESKLKKQVGDAWADAVKRLTGRTSAMKGVKGSHLKSRGIFEPIAAKDLDQWEQLGWEIRDPDYQAGTKASDLTARMNAGLIQPDEPIQMWRDYTRAERDKMGEIRDAGFRFVMGYMQTQRDIALGRMFEKMANDPASSSRIPQEGWVKVPDSTIEGTGAKRYGKLSGRYVPRETLSHLSQIEESQSAAWQFYRQGMAIWKMGKALALDTPIPTPDGWTTMGDLQVGDTVFDEKGVPCKVIHATDVQLDRNCFEVAFSDGEVITADEEHLWFTLRQGKPGVRTTADILGSLKYAGGRFNAHSVPLAKPLELPPANLPFDPYFVGVWLGNGRTDSPSITSSQADAEVLQSLLRERGMGIGAVRKDPRGDAVQYGVGFAEHRPRAQLLMPIMRKAGLLGNKHIPREYLRASVEQRLELLRGLMDTDGTIDSNGRCCFVTTLDILKDGFVELARSLGLKPSATVRTKSANGKEFQAWWVDFHADDSVRVFNLPRKAQRQRPAVARRARSLSRQIVSINAIPSVPVKCITVASESSLYLAGRSMVPTHNTAMNPVSHFNNIVSNLTMAHFAGVGYHRADKYVAAIKDFATAAPAIKEARDAGLFLGTMSDAELMNTLPKELQELAGKAESSTVKGAKRVFDLMTFFLRKPMGAAYQAEDTFFRYLIYKDARGRGLSPDDAIDYAQKFIFAYDDLPKGARMVRDFGIPFFAYTYKAVPALLSTALTHPVRFAAPAAVLWAANAMAYAIAAGDDDDTWAELLSKYLNDEDFRKKVREQEKLERDNLPPWMKGTTALLTPKAIRLGMDEVTKLPLFIDVARIIPGGDIFDVSPNAGGIPLPQPITPSHPLFSIATGMIANKDLWTGKELVDKNDTRIEAAEKRSEWMWKQISPAMAIGNYHWERGMNALAQASGGEIKWLPEFVAEDYTGVGRDRLPVQPGLAAMQTFGIKVRPIDIDKSIQMEGTMREKMIRDITAELRTLNRLNQDGVISDTRLEKERAKTEEKVQRLREGLTVDGDARP